MIQADTPCYCREKIFFQALLKMNNHVNSPALNRINKRSTMKNRCKSELCLRKYLIAVLIAVTISVALGGCRNKKMTPKRATEFATDRLNLSEEQS